MGEFVKQIIETFGLMYEGTKMDVFINLGEKMRGMIDEARQDFPILCEWCCEFDTSMERCNLHEYARKECPKTKFEKWFKNE